MSMVQIVLIGIFVYLGAIGSIVGNTIGWYTLGRPLVAAFVVGQVMWNVSYALNLPLNRLANKYAEAGETKKMFIPNTV